MNIVYLNMKTSHGVETVDEFSREEEKMSRREFLDYVREMVREYRLVGVDVYMSRRPTKEWKERYYVQSDI